MFTVLLNVDQKLEVNWNRQLFLDILWNVTSRVEIKGFQLPKSCQFRGISLQTSKNSPWWHASSRLFSVSVVTYSAVTSHLTCFIREWVTANVNKLLSEHQSNQWLCFKTYTVHPGNANFREWLVVLLINALAKENHGLLSLKMDI